MPTINAEYFDNLISSVNAVQTCDDLRKIAVEARASVVELQAAISAEIAKLTPILALLTAPGANLGQIVTWITDFINGVLRPLTAPILIYQTQLVELAAKVAELEQAITDAKNRIPHCSF